MLGAAAMHASTVESSLTSRAESWLERERASGRLYRRAAILIAIFLVTMLALSFWLLRYGGNEETLVKPVPCCWWPISALRLQ